MPKVIENLIKNNIPIIIKKSIYFILKKIKPTFLFDSQVFCYDSLFFFEKNVKLIQV